jgi:hypothetical protein
MKEWKYSFFPLDLGTGVIIPVAQWMRGWMRKRAGLAWTLWRLGKCYPCQDSNPCRPARLSNPGLLYDKFQNEKQITEISKVMQGSL